MSIFGSKLILNTAHYNGLTEHVRYFEDWGLFPGRHDAWQRVILRVRAR
jgi:hypothetical protein